MQEARAYLAKQVAIWCPFGGREAKMAAFVCRRHRLHLAVDVSDHDDDDDDYNGCVLTSQFSRGQRKTASHISFPLSANPLSLLGAKELI